MQFELLPEAFKYTYECEPCEVRGYGNECWLCGHEDTIRKIAQYTLAPNAHPGVRVEDLLSGVGDETV